jgi:hypothetical protein
MVMKQLRLLLSVTALIIFSGFSSCKKEVDAHVPPDMAFKTGAGYTSADATLAQGDSITVGVNITKTEDDLRTFNIGYAYDGAGSSTTYYNYVLTAAEYLSYSHDHVLHTRNQAGTEKWTFTVTDRDGNVTQKSITLTVQ